MVQAPAFSSSPESPAFPSDGGFSIDFGDGPPAALDSLPPDDEPLGGAGLSRFDVEAQWKNLCTSFCEQEPLGGAYLQGTQLVKGDYALTPFPLTVVFRGAQQWQYQQFSTHPSYQTHLLEFLEAVLCTQVDLRLSLTALTPEEMAAAQGGPARALSPLEIDLRNEPILSTLVELFAAEPIGMRRVPRENEYNNETTEPGECE